METGFTRKPMIFGDECCVSFNVISLKRSKKINFSILRTALSQSRSLVHCVLRAYDHDRRIECRKVECA